MRFQQFILQFFPAHVSLEKKVIALRGELALAEARLEMAQQRMEANAVPVARKPPVIRTHGWREFQGIVADLQEKEQ